MYIYVKLILYKKNSSGYLNYRAGMCEPNGITILNIKKKQTNKQNQMGGTVMLLISQKVKMAHTDCPPD